MITMMKLPILKGQAPLRVARGHFATNHSHINYYIDITYQKTRLSEAKAVAKALGTGFIRGIMPWTIEVTHAESGAPGVRLHGAAKERLEALGGQCVHLSLSHEGDNAMAFVVIEG